MPSVVNVYRVERLGSGVAEVLDSLRGPGGTVIAVFARSAHLRAAGGRMLALQDRALALSPWSARLTERPPSWPRLGSPVRAEDDVLRVDVLRFRLPTVATQPTPASSAVGEPWGATQCWSLACRAIAPFSEGSAFGAGWYQSLGTGFADSDPVPGPADRAPTVAAAEGLATAMVDAGGRVVRRLVGAVREGDEAAATVAATDLLGLGPGLTPAGDDLLIGFFAAWQRFDPACLDPELRRRSLARLVALAPLVTTPASAEFLYHLAAGRVGEPLDDLLKAMLVGDLRQVERAARIVATEGHTSGRDCLTGILALLVASLPAEPAVRRTCHLMESTV